jgi:endonuclease/exonuclease/phosphatase family metal-dependent hydrolase
VRLIVCSWNLFHGRTSPEGSTLHLEAAVRLIAAGEPDVVCLQELPVWAVGSLAGWSGMQAFGAVAMPPLGGPLARRLTERSPRRLRSGLTGQANAILVSRRLRVTEIESIVLNPRPVRRREARRQGLPTAVRRAWARNRRVSQLLRVGAGDETATVVNCHLTACGDSRPAGVELLRAVGRAEAWRRPHEPIVLCGDFNLTPASSKELRSLAEHGFSPPLPRIDQILVRGLVFERAPEAWPDERRRHDGLLLSDHAPLEAELTTA